MEPNVPARADAANDADAMIAVLRETVVLLRQALARLLGEDAGPDYGLGADGSESVTSITERNLALHRLSGRLLDQLRDRS